MKIISFLSLFLICGSCFSQDSNLIWSDEFNSNGAPDSNYWSYNLGATGYGNNEIQNYTDNLANSRQENGVLVIEAHKKGGEWTSARLISKDKFSFTYGRIVFRAKLPSGIGTWPALWMLAQNIDEVGWPEGAIKDKDTWPFDKPQFIIMNIAMGGNFGSYPEMETNGLKNGIEPGLSTARMEVDYVRVYKNEDSK